MDSDTTYNVRMHKTEIYKGVKVTTYYVRWNVGGRACKEPFRNVAQADSFRSELVTAARKGEAFSITTGLPVSWKRDEPTGPTWYAFTLSYTEAKWPYASPNHRRGIAEALTDATEAMLIEGRHPPERAALRHALRAWSYSKRLRDEESPPSDLTAVLGWLEANTIALDDLAEPGIGPARIRAVLDRISRKQDGKMAAANTANRKRTVVNNALEYAVELNLLPANPARTVKWTRPRTLKTVDPRAVVNSDQARRFIEAVANQGDRGARMKAFFGSMYYAALRPEEATDLHRDNLVKLPRRGWGEMLLTHSKPRSGTYWTDDGTPRQRSTLKHRAPGDTRTVPIHPDLVMLLRDHIGAYGIGPGGRLFVGARGGILTDRAYLAIFHKARVAGFTPAELASLLARHPYDLRHAAVSTWLNAGVGPPQVAEWAGHSVDVLLRVYAKCISGQQNEAKRRILEATQADNANPGQDEDM